MTVKLHKYIDKYNYTFLPVLLKISNIILFCSPSSIFSSLTHFSSSYTSTPQTVPFILPPPASPTPHLSPPPIPPPPSLYPLPHPPLPPLSSTSSTSTSSSFSFVSSSLTSSSSSSYSSSHLFLLLLLFLLPPLPIPLLPPTVPPLLLFPNSLLPCYSSFSSSTSPSSSSPEGPGG